MRQENYQPTADDYAGDMQGDVEAAKWDAKLEEDREVAYYEKLAYSNPEDESTRQAQQWLARRDQLITDAN